MKKLIALVIVVGLLAFSLGCPPASGTSGGTGPKPTGGTPTTPAPTK